MNIEVINRSQQLNNPRTVTMVGHCDSIRMFLYNTTQLQYHYCDISIDNHTVPLHIFHGKMPYDAIWYEEIIQMTQIYEDKTCIFLGIRNRTTGEILGWKESSEIANNYEYGSGMCKAVSYTNKDKI